MVDPRGLKFLTVPRIELEVEMAMRRYYPANPRRKQRLAGLCK
jgi:hypothetical protein